MNKEPIFFKLGKTAVEKHKMLEKMYRDECLYLYTIREWFKQFKEGRGDLKTRVEIFVPKGQTATAVFYHDVMKRLLAHIRRVRLEYRKKGSWCLLHDNAPAHRSTLITDFFTKNGILTINHSPYLPYLAPCDFYSFGKLHTFDHERKASCRH